MSNEPQAAVQRLANPYYLKMVVPFGRSSINNQDTSSSRNMMRSPKGGWMRPGPNPGKGCNCNKSLRRIV